MFARRAAIGGSVLVTVVLVLSSMGLLGALGVGSAGAVAPSSASLPAASPAAGPAALSTASTTTAALSTPGHVPLSRPTAPPSDAERSAKTPLGSQILHTLATDGVPLHDAYLPDLLYAGGPARQPSNGHVNLSFTSGPAPWGIGEYGLKNVSGTITPYSLSTPSIEANFTTAGIYGLAADISAPDEYGVQLNAVLNDVSLLGNPNYEIWTQNVFAFSPSLKNLTFISNLWNFSNPNFVFDCNSIYAVGGPYAESGCVPGVYAYAESSPVEAEYPFEVQVYLNSTLLSGRDAVYFNYTVSSGLGTYAGNYFYAIFNSLAPGELASSTPKPMYVAEGSTYDPAGLPNDFEVMIGGPGGGSNFDLVEASSTYMTLQYWNTTRGAYLTVPSAYNVAGETGETSDGVISAWAETGAATCVDCAELSNGPSFLYGMWGIGGLTPAGNVEPEHLWSVQAAPFFVLDQVNAFLFIAQGSSVFTTWTGTNWSLYQWAPDFEPYTYFDNLPVGNYSYVVVLANYEAAEGTFTLATGITYDYITVNLGTQDTTMGVYTPMWAINDTGLDNLESGLYDGYGDPILYNNEYAPIGQIPFNSLMGSFGDAAYFPWFGEFNEYGYQVFPGLMIWNEGFFDVDAEPSFTVSAPPTASYQLAVNHWGWPQENSLQTYFEDDGYMYYDSNTVTGWFPAVSYFGLDQSFASVTFWNDSYDDIFDNTFEVGGMGVFLYGGEDNYIASNWFVTGASPPSANPYATVAEDWGSIGLVDADWGDAYLYGSGAWDLCTICDRIYNNAFDTLVTASSLGIDPYTGLFPTLGPGAFSSAWNWEYEPGVTNIVGGNYFGGNYWWDYGLPDNPYGSLPDEEENWLPADEGLQDNPATICDNSGGLCWGGHGDNGDYYPLVTVPVYSVTFKELGLPSGTDWYVWLYDYDLTFTDYQLLFEYYFYFEETEFFNETAAPGTLGFLQPGGDFGWDAYSTNSNFVAVPYYGDFTVTGTSVTITVQFVHAYHLTVDETGLPSGTEWSAGACETTVSWCEDNTTHGTQTNVSALPAGTYHWNAEADGYASTPSEVFISISANTTVQVTFVTAYRLNVHEVGLPGGEEWIFSASDGTLFNYSARSGGDWINLTVGSGSYSWLAASPGFAASPASGIASVTAETNLTITFTSAPSATGTLSGTVTPASATLWIDGTQEPLSAGGAYSEVLPIGIHSVEVQESGYATYFNNVTVSLGQTTTLNIALTPVTSTSSGLAGIGGTGWLLIGLLAAIAAILLVTTLIFARRGRSPPPVAPYNAPSGAGGAPPSGEAPAAWQETPPPPSGGGT